MMDRMAELRDEAKQDLETELRELLPLLSAARGIVSHSPNATITVSAGGVGTWVCALMATVCFITTVIMAILYVDHSRRIDDLGHYLQAIYQAAPSLQETQSKRQNSP